MIYLYIKQHQKTGLKYFGKTVKANPFKYNGSGSYWYKHLKEHGKHIRTIEIWGFDDQQLCTQFALKFSKDNNIVESKEWANLVPEDGISGGSIGSRKGRKLSEQTKAKMSKTRKGYKYGPEFAERFRQRLLGVPKTEEQKRKMRLAKLGKPQSEEHKMKRSEAMKRAHAIKKLSLNLSQLRS